MRSGKRPFTDDVVSIAEDGVDLSFAVREEFEYLRQEFRQALLVLEFELERMVLECELVVKLIYDFNEVPLSAGRQSGLQNPIRASASTAALSRTVLCVFIGIYSFFCFLAVSSNC
jgi:hypothetical protein